MIILDYHHRVMPNEIEFTSTEELSQFTNVIAIFAKKYEKWPLDLFNVAWEVLSPYGFLYLSINLTECLMVSDDIMDIVDLKHWKVLNTDIIEEGSDKVFQVRLGVIKEN